MEKVGVTPGKTSQSVTHPEIAPGQTCLTPEFFVAGLSEKEGIPWWYDYSINPIKP
jgi:hypothetical protein